MITFYVHLVLKLCWTSLIKISVPDPQKILLSCKICFVSCPEDFGDDIGINSLIAVSGFKFSEAKKMLSFIQLLVLAWGMKA